MTTTSTHRITAAELRPGDVVLAANGARAFAAFDVAVGDQDDNGMTRVTVWTAVSDQDAGKPASLELTSWEELTVTRRDGGPTITRTTLTPVVQPDGEVAVQIDRAVVVSAYGYERGARALAQCTDDAEVGELADAIRRSRRNRGLAAYGCTPAPSC